ncbi:hydroxyisourate hydrolase [Paenibacillus sacheonensis]|uniref:5-hydroxyisourate hydrolase n=1 Tax=Paenibacillus sacheonensis TaxID=742054 RepID=A0A7X4YKU2_9BACL|nr:hydroxyisourate hydrolase [Paenibacillus sacheonensis]MBM7563299.1 5-hydroxyisourate hydrolase [Paenibacillus sacheonensis]NBC68143.1 hydroxyisourate hydrolase [Paenibacillus sacheonensis]
MSKGGRVTTHVLDTSRGIPAAGLRIRLLVHSALGEEPIVVADVMTNEDGRVDRPLLAGEELQAGVHELMFDVGGYFGDRAFLDWVPIRFTVHDPGVHYHVPLLVAPFGYSTYRGS